MTGRLKFAALVTITGALCVPAAFAASAAPLSGSIAGFVRDGNGIAQMGATVVLYNRYEKLVYQTITNERGIFGFDALTPDVYSVRVSLASFVPAVKNKIAVQPGMQSLLYVDLASILSSIELVYAAPGQGALMSEDWKWTLKASTNTRPILRMLPGTTTSDPDKRDKPVGSVFSDTRGVLKVSAGDPGSLGSSTSQSDLGTAFALSTSVFGRNQVQVSGNVGYSAGAGIPTSGFRTSYSRDGAGPEVAVSVQQVYLPGRGDLANLTGQPAGAPPLRTISFAVRDSIALTDNLRVDYGAALDSVSFLSHLNYVSKFTRFNYSLGDNGIVRFAYSSGAPPMQFLTASRESQTETARTDANGLAEDLTALSQLPRLALLDGRTTIQRSQNMELGYERRIHSTTIDITGYHETVTNSAITIAAADDVFPIGDVLPDISSRSSVLNAGSFQAYGYAGSVSQALGDRVELGFSVGRGGALALAQQNLDAATADDLRSRIRSTERFWASARASATVPVTGTKVTASYQWTDYSALMPEHYYLTQRATPEPGLNIYVRQPIPGILGMPGRLEATAELRNALAQGYLPISSGGQPILLIQSPRALRGGLSFIF